MFVLFNALCIFVKVQSKIYGFAKINKKITEKMIAKFTPKPLSKTNFKKTLIEKTIIKHTDLNLLAIHKSSSKEGSQKI